MFVLCSTIACSRNRLPRIEELRNRPAKRCLSKCIISSELISSIGVKEDRNIVEAFRVALGPIRALLSIHSSSFSSRIGFGERLNAER